VQQAIASDDPVVFLEPKRRYWDKGEVGIQADRAPDSLYAARVLREGSEAVLLGYGPTVRTCLDAADAAAEDGHSLGVIDLRSLSPVDWVTLVNAARAVGRVIVVHEAHRTLGLGAEIAARLSEECFYSLESPVLRVTGYDTPYPPSRMEDVWLPDVDRVLDAVDEALAF
jgi:2-oxoisovalerate dehydrogenase E1 component beta subunit